VSDLSVAAKIKPTSEHPTTVGHPNDTIGTNVFIQNATINPNTEININLPIFVVNIQSINSKRGFIILFLSY
jgi:hypothetical protein